MKSRAFGCVAFAAICLAGCHPKTAEEAASGNVNLFGIHHGRFVGLGIYAPQEPWTKMVDAARPTDSPAAKTIDDQAIFVVVDSQTGELRACGDLSGYCIGMNPWKRPLTTAQTVPIILTEHVKRPATSPDAGVKASPATSEPNPVKQGSADTPSPAH
ncbi:MAG: hypothetical protein P4L73_11345 [Caulobacteraceae bacterium]|nr:hypothetical protein [Caulobacteraceae bacterium]